MAAALVYKDREAAATVLLDCKSCSIGYRTGFTANKNALFLDAGNDVILDDKMLSPLDPEGVWI